MNAIFGPELSHILVESGRIRCVNYICCLASSRTASTSKQYITVDKWGSSKVACNVISLQTRGVAFSAQANSSFWGRTFATMVLIWTGRCGAARPYCGSPTLSHTYLCLRSRCGAESELRLMSVHLVNWKANARWWAPLTLCEYVELLVNLRTPIFTRQLSVQIEKDRSDRHIWPQLRKGRDNDLAPI